MDARVSSFVEETRKGCATCNTNRHRVLEQATPTEDEENSLNTFGARVKWAKNLVSRHGLVSRTLHGKAGSVDDAAIAECVAEICRMSEKSHSQNVFNVVEAGIFYKAVAAAHVPCLIPEYGRP